MQESKDPDAGGQLIGGMAGAGCVGWESQKKRCAESYSGLVELFNDGWFYAVKLELLCPSDRVRSHSSYKSNGQKVAEANSVIIDAIHVRIVNRTHLQPSEAVFFYWDPLHVANPKYGPWAEGWRRPAMPEPIMDMVLRYFLGRGIGEASVEPEEPVIETARDTEMIRKFKAMSADAPHAEHATEQLEDTW